jgi:hypothetical protein
MSFASAVGSSNPFSVLAPTQGNYQETLQGLEHDISKLRRKILHIEKGRNESVEMVYPELGKPNPETPKNPTSLQEQVLVDVVKQKIFLELLLLGHQALHEESSELSKGPEYLRKKIADLTETRDRLQVELKNAKSKVKELGGNPKEGSLGDQIDKYMLITQEKQTIEKLEAARAKIGQIVGTPEEELLKGEIDQYERELGSIRKSLAVETIDRQKELLETQLEDVKDRIYYLDNALKKREPFDKRDIKNLKIQIPKTPSPTKVRGEKLCSPSSMLDGGTLLADSHVTNVSGKSPDCSHSSSPLQTPAALSTPTRGDRKQEVLYGGCSPFPKIIPTTPLSEEKNSTPPHFFSVPKAELEKPGLGRSSTNDLEERIIEKKNELEVLREKWKRLDEQDRTCASYARTIQKMQIEVPRHQRTLSDQEDSLVRQKRAYTKYIAMMFVEHKEVQEQYQILRQELPIAETDSDIQVKDEAAASHYFNLQCRIGVKKFEHDLQFMIVDLEMQIEKLHKELSRAQAKIVKLDENASISNELEKLKKVKKLLEIRFEENEKNQQKGVKAILHRLGSSGSAASVAPPTPANDLDRKLMNAAWSMDLRTPPVAPLDSLNELKESEAAIPEQVGEDSTTPYLEPTTAHYLYPEVNPMPTEFHSPPIRSQSDPLN